MINQKSEMFSKFRIFKAMVENQLGKSIKCFRSGNDGEYTSNEFELFMKKHGIIHQTTVPYNPQQNDIVERTNISLAEKTRCMLFESELNKRFWAETMNMAIYLKNRSPTATLKSVVPEEA